MSATPSVPSRRSPAEARAAHLSLQDTVHAVRATIAKRLGCALEPYERRGDQWIATAVPVVYPTEDRSPEPQATAIAVPGASLDQALASILTADDMAGRVRGGAPAHDVAERLVLRSVYDAVPSLRRAMIAAEREVGHDGALWAGPGKRGSVFALRMARVTLAVPGRLGTRRARVQLPLVFRSPKDLSFWTVGDVQLVDDALEAVATGAVGRRDRIAYAAAQVESVEYGIHASLADKRQRATGGWSRNGWYPAVTPRPQDATLIAAELLSATQLLRRQQVVRAGAAIVRELPGGLS